jgi:hypothetical protein
MHQGPVKVGLALGQGEFDVAQAAVTQDRHEDGDPPRGGALADPATRAPVHLQGLARLPVHFLIDCAIRETTASAVAKSTSPLDLDSVSQDTLLSWAIRGYPTYVQFPTIGVFRNSWMVRCLSQGHSNPW